MMGEWRGGLKKKGGRVGGREKDADGRGEKKRTEEGRVRAREGGKGGTRRVSGWWEEGE